MAGSPRFSPIPGRLRIHHGRHGGGPRHALRPRASRYCVHLGHSTNQWMLVRMFDHHGPHDAATRRTDINSAMKTSCPDRPEWCGIYYPDETGISPFSESTPGRLSLHIIGVVKRLPGGRETACTLYLALTSRSPPSPAEGSCNPPASPSWHALTPVTPSFSRGEAAAVCRSIH